MSINKQELFFKCHDLLDERIEKYSQEMKSIQESNDLEDVGNNYEEQIGAGEILGDVEFLSIQLDRAREMKENLSKIDPEMRNEYIGLGSVVETETTYYFISVALGKIDMEDGSSAHAISQDAPLFKALEGKSPGESVTFKGDTITIINLW